jgi:hypothetical protein
MPENVQWPLVSLLETVQREYEELRRRGESHNIAKMCVLRKTPALLTDDVFLAGRRNHAQFANNPVLGQRYKAVAESEGLDIVGKTYVSGLAAYPGDPRAWVRDRGEAKRLLEERGWGSEGAVNVKVREPDVLPDDPAIDPKLVDREVAHRQESGDMLDCKTTEELKEKLTDLRSWKSDSEIGKD